MNGSPRARVYTRTVRFSQVFRSDSWYCAPGAARLYRRLRKREI